MIELALSLAIGISVALNVWMVGDWLEKRT